MESCVLVVEPDEIERDRIALWLEREGYRVMVCPGPQAPEFACIGVRSGTCPLARSADVVVLDMRLGGDEVMHGVAAWELVGLYRRAGAAVVAIASSGETAAAADVAEIEVVRRPAREPDLVAAVRAARKRSAAAASASIAAGV